jgi:calcineurin-like phosphoesterase family protein
MSNLFFSSDMHFNHKNIIKYCNRPFSSVEEMNEALVSNWNSKISPKDEVWVLGDVSWGRFDLNRLNGRKKLIIGNHDRLDLLIEYFDECYDFYNLEGIPSKKSLIPLCHYPLESWNRKFHGSIHLHGHTHNTLDNSGLLRFDVGVDAWNMFPVSMDEILAKVPERQKQAEGMAPSREVLEDRDRRFREMNATADREYVEGEEGEEGG